jgi:hypothetical protein
MTYLNAHQRGNVGAAIAHNQARLEHLGQDPETFYVPTSLKVLTALFNETLDLRRLVTLLMKRPPAGGLGPSYLDLSETPDAAAMNWALDHRAEALESLQLLRDVLADPGAQEILR